jgi:hypothetical protein
VALAPAKWNKNNKKFRLQCSKLDEVASKQLLAAFFLNHYALCD